MNGYEQFLVIILATFLAIFLLLAIALLALLIKLVKTINRITDKAESLANKAEAVGEFFEHAATPMAVGRALTTIVEKFFSKKHSAHESKRKG
jgi:hypothetical protein